MRSEVMRHMLKDNIGLTVGRQVKASKEWRHCFISNSIIESTFISNKTSEITYFLSLYIYPDEEKRDLFNHKQTEKEPNIQQSLFDTLSVSYDQKPTPEEILYYIYSVFYSTIYRETYAEAEFLRVDFPRVPFTSNYGLFKTMGDLGIKLADLHLLKSPELDPPVAKYQGSGANDRIDKITYKEDEQRIYINKDKYFEGVTSEVWNYHIGGYQVLHKYLKDRKVE